MRGYLLPFQAAVQVLLVCEGVEGPLLAHAEVLHLGLIGGGPYQALLNWSAWQGDSSLVEEISEKEVLMVYWTFAKAQYLSNPSPSFRAHREPSC